MKYEIAYSNSFKRDYKKMQRRGKDMKKLAEIINTLAAGKPLDKKHRVHTLQGKYNGMHECHIEPDWLLVWIVDNDRLVLLFSHTGTHSDLFR